MVGKSKGVPSVPIVCLSCGEVTRIASDLLASEEHVECESCGHVRWLRDGEVKLHQGAAASRLAFANPKFAPGGVVSIRSKGRR
ncbi:MAG: hypothetical protein ACT4PT_00215 [Methanobacteriota archaeon]